MREEYQKIKDRINARSPTAEADPEEEEIELAMLMKRKTAIEMAMKSSKIRNQNHKSIHVPGKNVSVHRTRVSVNTGNSQSP